MILTNLFQKPIKLIALYSFRYDYNLVPDLIKNVEGFVDDFISWDDRKNDALWYHEGNIRRALIEKAREAKADWVICVDPDERFEKNAGRQIRELITKKEPNIYSFKFREMWTPTQYRIDGVWGTKKKWILFPLLPNQEFMNLKVHSGWAPINSNYKQIETDINLYHLKMIFPENRESRKEIYNKLDPNKEIQPIGYDYLTDEATLQLESIPSNREYFPPFNPDYKYTIKV